MSFLANSNSITFSPKKQGKFIYSSSKIQQAHCRRIKKATLCLWTQGCTIFSGQKKKKKKGVVSHLPLNALPAVQTWTANCKRDRKTVVTWHSQLCGFPWKPWWPYWSHSYVCVTIARRLDMSKFTKGIWQITFTVNIERPVRTWKPSFRIEKYFERIPSRPERVCKFADLFSSVFQ